MHEGKSYHSKELESCFHQCLIVACKAPLDETRQLKTVEAVVPQFSMHVTTWDEHFANPIGNKRGQIVAGTVGVQYKTAPEWQNLD